MPAKEPSPHKRHPRNHLPYAVVACNDYFLTDEVKTLLEDDGYLVHTTYVGELAYTAVEQYLPDVLVLDSDLEWSTGGDAAGYLAGQLDFADKKKKSLLVIIADSKPEWAHFKTERCIFLAEENIAELPALIRLHAPYWQAWRREEGL